MVRSGFILLILLISALAAPRPRAAAAPPVPSAVAGPLGFYYDLYTFRGEGGRTRVVAAFAVPAGRLEETEVGDEVRYRFDVSLVVADTALKSVVRTDDSVFVAATRPLAGRHLLFTQVEMEAPPSRSTVHRVIMTDASTPGTGQLYGDGFPVPDYSGTDLMISDIALGDPEVEGGWERGDVSLALLPTSQFPESDFEVYYEIYNLPPATRYATEIAVEEVDARGRRLAGGGGPVRLRFSGASPAWSGDVVRELRRVEAELDEGRYRLTVTIRSERTGETVSRSRLFHVRGWGPGATMVAALPRRDA